MDFFGSKKFSPLRGDFFLKNFATSRQFFTPKCVSKTDFRRKLMIIVNESARSAKFFAFKGVYDKFSLEISNILNRFGHSGGSFGYFLVPEAPVAGPFGYLLVPIWVQKNTDPWAVCPRLQSSKLTTIAERKGLTQIPVGG